MHSPVNFSTFEMNFRSADAANHFNALRVCEPRRVNDLLRQQNNGFFIMLLDHTRVVLANDIFKDTTEINQAVFIAKRNLFKSLLSRKVWLLPLLLFYLVGVLEKKLFFIFVPDLVEMVTFLFG